MKLPEVKCPRCGVSVRCDLIDAPLRCHERCPLDKLPLIRLHRGELIGAEHVMPARIKIVEPIPT